MGSPSDIRVGPGLLYANVAGSALPDLGDPWEAETVPWIPFGYTDEGHAFTYTPKFDPIEVAEEKVPVRYEESSSELRLEFALAEITAANFKTAFNGGTINTATLGQIKFTPPTAGAPAVRIAIGWEATDLSERWVWYKCLQTGAVEVGRRKAPAKTTIPMGFMVEIPLGGGAPFDALFADPA